MRRAPLAARTARCCCCWLLRPHNVRALAVLLVISLSLLLCSTLTTTIHQDQQRLLAAGISDKSPSASALKTSTAIKKDMKMRGFILPAPAAVLRSRNLYYNQSVTLKDIDRTLQVLDKKLEEGKRQLFDDPTASSAAEWNTTRKRRLLIVTSWRSGSTFLAQILSEHPGVFQHYEPLMHFGLQQIRPDGSDRDSQAAKAVDHLNDLLHCKYENKDFVRKVKENQQDMMSHNGQVWTACVLGPNRNTCSSSQFLEQACRRFPTLIMKIVRLRLNLTDSLLEEMPDLKVLYLVRDPRGVMNSRLGSVDWCSRSVDCIEPQRLCNDVISDLDAFEVLKKRYPDRVALVKYETLAKEPQTSFESLFHFAGLSYLQRIRTLVDRHTSRDVDQPWSTSRKSAERIERWRTKLNASKIVDIESVCTDVLDRLGYKAFQL